MAIYVVKLINDEGLESTIDVAEEQTIFDAAEDQGVDLPISCRSGSCSTCAGIIVSG
jgi:ferredoxin